jgi:hypothetical protein
MSVRSRLSRFLSTRSLKSCPDHRMGHFRTRTIAHMITSSRAPLKGGRGSTPQSTRRGDTQCAHKKWAFAG